uniref:Uncharacterized protein n=1 Tax=Physcomitrium patens TaxID=3218 RepID=A0A2K1KPP1_PHYPA|nr:hypothetical protein PHYPA_006637 [Physcomitrium patens]
MRNNTYRGEERYPNRGGYRSNNYENKLQPRYEEDRIANSLRRSYVNQPKEIKEEFDKLFKTFFRLLFINAMLERIVGHELYSMLSRFNGYN